MGRAASVFVEMGLDATQYTNAQKQILQSSMSTALESEKNFKTLGTQSDLIFNTMKQNVINAYGAIANSSKSTTTEIARAHEAMGNKIKEINEQMAGPSFFDKMKSNWLAVSAAVYGAMKLMSEGRALMEQGAKSIQIESSFKILAQEAGVDADKYIAALKKGTRGAVEESDLMQKASKAMMAGYDPKQIVDFSNVVVAASIYMGTSVTESYEKILDSISSRMPKAMVQSGAVTKTQMKVVTEAIAGGVEDTVLLSLAIENLRLKTLELQGTQDEAIIAMQRHDAQMKEMKETVGKALVGAFQILMGVLDAVASGFFAVVYGIDKFQEASANAKAWILEMLPGQEAAAKNLRAIAKGWEESATAAKKNMEELDKNARDKLWLGDPEKEKLASAESIKAQKDKVTAMVDNLKTYGKAAQKAADDAAKAQEKDLENQRKYLGLQTEAQKSTDAVLLAQLENSHRLFEISDTDYYQKKLALIGENRDKETSYLEKQDALSYASYQVKWANAKSDQERSAANSELELKRMESAVKMQQIKDKAIIDGENLVTTEILKQRELRLSGMQFAYQEEEKLAAHLLDMFKGTVAQEGDADKDKFDRMDISSTEYTAREIERTNLVRDASIASILATTRAFQTAKLAELALSPGDDKKAQEINQTIIAQASAAAQQIDKIKQDAAGKEANLDRSLAKAREELWASSAAGIKGAEGALYNYKLGLAEKERQRIIQDTGDEALANQVYANRVRDNYIEMAQSSNDWVVGVKAGLLDLQKGQTTWGQAAEDLTKKTFGHMETAAGDLFFDVITGNLDDLGKVFENLWKSILRDFVDMIAKMVIEWLALQALMMAFPEIKMNGSVSGGTASGVAGSVGNAIVNKGVGMAATAGYEYLTGTTIPATEYAAQAVGLTEGTTSGAGGAAMAGGEAAGGGAAIGGAEAAGAGTAAGAGGGSVAAPVAAEGAGVAGGSSAAGSTMATVGAAAPYAVAALWAAYVMYRAFTDHRATPQETVKHDVESLNWERVAPGTQNWNASGTGGSVGEMTPENLARIIDEMDYAGKEFGKTKADVLSWTAEALGPANVELVKTAEQMTLTKDALADLSGNFQAGAKPNADYQESIDLLKTTMATSTDPVKDLTAAITANSDYSITSAGAVQLLADTMGLSADQTKDLTTAFADTAYTADHTGEQIDKLSKTLGIDKEAAKNLGQSLGLIPPVLDDATDSAYAMILQVQGAGLSFTSAAEAVAAMTASMALNASQGDSLKAIFADTDYVAAHIDETIAKLADTLDISKNSAEDLAKALGLIPKNVEVNIGVVTTGNMPASSPGYATGGLIRGGSGTKDDLIIAAMGGEFMVNADSTARNLKLLRWLNDGHSIPGFAAGGIVPGWSPSTVNVGPGDWVKPIVAQDATPEQQNAAAVEIQRRTLELKLLSDNVWTASEAVTKGRQDEIAAMDASLRPLQEKIWIQELANDKDAKTIELWKLQGNAVGALAMERAKELLSMDPALRGIQQQIYAQQDLNDANDKAAKQAEADAALAKQRAGLEIDLMTAQGDATGALAATRQQELDALDPSLRSLKEQIYAAQDQKKATDDLAKAQTDAANALQAALGKLAPEQFSTSYEYRKAVGLTKIRGYDSGGFFPGGLRIVGESGPEIEWTGPSRIFNNKESKGLVSNGEVVQAIRELRDDLVELGVQGLIINGKTAKAITKWDGIGLPASQDNLTTFGN